jgi:hypothetical protein
MSAAIGWIATALFASSYLFKRQAALRKAQALGAGVWVVYGVVIHALPVVVANVATAGMALWSLYGRGARSRVAVPAEPAADVEP